MTVENEGSVEPEETEVTQTVAEVPAEESVETSAPVAEGEEEEDFSNWTLEDAVARLKETRAEAAKYRTERNRYAESFEGLDDDVADAFLEAVKAIQNDPESAAQGFSELAAALAAATGISTEDAESLVEDALDEEEDDDLPQTKAELEEYLKQREEKSKAEREQERAREEARKEVDDKIAELGYKAGTKQFNDLLYYANQEEEGSVSEKLEAANKRVQADRQSVIDEFLAEQAGKVDEVPPLTDGGSVAPASPEKPKDIKSGAKAAKAALDAIYSDAASE